MEEVDDEIEYLWWGGDDIMVCAIAGVLDAAQIQRIPLAQRGKRLLSLYSLNGVSDREPLWLVVWELRSPGEQPYKQFPIDVIHPFKLQSLTFGCGNDTRGETQPPVPTYVSSSFRLGCVIMFVMRVPIHRENRMV